MHKFRVVVLNLGLSGIAISIAYTAFLLDRILTLRLPNVLALVAWPLLVFGTSIILWAVVLLARYAGATGAPGDPTKKLVAKGPFAWVRNPIYGADAIIIMGLAFLTGSPSMLLYDLLYVLGMDIYVRVVEEPALERRFGEAYARYKEAVPRWFPGIIRGLGSTARG